MARSRRKSRSSRFAAWTLAPWPFWLMAGLFGVSLFLPWFRMRGELPADLNLWASATEPSIRLTDFLFIPLEHWTILTEAPGSGRSPLESYVDLGQDGSLAARRAHLLWGSLYGVRVAAVLRWVVVLAPLALAAAAALWALDRIDARWAGWAGAAALVGYGVIRARVAWGQAIWAACDAGWVAGFWLATFGLLGMGLILVARAHASRT